MNHPARTIARGAAAALLALTLCLGLSSQTTKRKVSDADRLAVRGDLTIASLDVARLGLNADGSHRVRLTVNARFSCTVRTASCGAFKILAEYRDGLGAYTRLGEAGIAGASAGGASVTPPLVVRTFDTSVPAGVTRTFRATVDSAGAITETNEYNNQATKSYTASGCAGVDLVLTQVEVQRSGSGAVVHVWVRNRCLEVCDGRVTYSVDPRECVPEAGAQEQEIGRRFEGDTRYGPLGNMLVPGREGADIIYTVAINVSGAACRDSDLTNNSSRVVLPAGETRRVFYLR